MLQVIMSRFGIGKIPIVTVFFVVADLDDRHGRVCSFDLDRLPVGSRIVHESGFHGMVRFLAVGRFVCFERFSFIVFRTFRSVIRHTTLREIWKLGGAVLFKDLLMFFYVLLLPQKPSPPYAALSMGFLLDVLVTLFLLLALRLCMIILYDLIKLKHARHDNCQQVLVYGTGDKSVSLVTRLQNSPHYQVSGFLTYGKLLKNHTIADRPVYYFEDECSIEYLRDRYDIDGVLFATNDDAQCGTGTPIRYCTERALRS